MKIENYKKYGRERFLNIEQISSNKGDGTLENPILFDPSSSFPKHLQIRESDLYIQINNCVLYSLILKKCENITINKAKFYNLQVEKSSNIVINDSKFDNALVLLRSQNVQIQDCNINSLGLTFSHKNSIVNCMIEDAKNDFSKANTFQNLQFSEKPDKYKKELIKSYFTRKINYLITIVLIAVTISGTMRLWDLGRGAAVSFLLIMLLGILFYVSVNLYSYLSIRQLEQNRWLA